MRGVSRAGKKGHTGKNNKRKKGRKIKAKADGSVSHKGRSHPIILGSLGFLFFFRFIRKMDVGCN